MIEEYWAANWALHNCCFTYLQSNCFHLLGSHPDITLYITNQVRLDCRHLSLAVVIKTHLYLVFLSQKHQRIFLKTKRNVNPYWRNQFSMKPKSQEEINWVNKTQLKIMQFLKLYVMSISSFLNITEVYTLATHIVACNYKQVDNSTKLMSKW